MQAVLSINRFHLDIPFIHRLYIREKPRFYGESNGIWVPYEQGPDECFNSLNFQTFGFQL